MVYSIQNLQPKFWHLRSSDVRSHGSCGVSFSASLSLGQGIENRCLAALGQPDDADFQEWFLCVTEI